MTFRSGSRSPEDLIALDDGRATAGTRMAAAREVSFHPHTPMPMAFKLACLSFDSSRSSSRFVAFQLRQCRISHRFHDISSIGPAVAVAPVRRRPARAAPVVEHKHQRAARRRARRIARTLRFSARFAVAQPPIR
jgi:hypothetical protein